MMPQRLPASLTFMNRFPFETFKAQSPALKYLVCVTCLGFTLFSFLRPYFEKREHEGKLRPEDKS